MPLITPPSDIPPDYQGDTPIKEKLITNDDYHRLLDYMNVPNWICSDCKLTNFGRNKYCANWKCKKVRP